MRTRRFVSLPMLMFGAGALVVGLAMPAAAHEASHLINGKTIKPHSITGSKLKNDTLTGKQIKESTLGTVPKAASATTATTARSLTPLTWHAIDTFVGGWKNFTGGMITSQAAYAVDAQGQVHLRGGIQGGTADAVAFTLPADITPATGTQLEVTSAMHNSTVGVLVVSSAGVKPEDPSGGAGDASAFTDLDGVVYSPGSS